MISTETPRPPEPHITARLLRPFLTVLRGHPNVPERLRAHYESMDPDRRVAASTAMALLRAAEALPGEPDLGLRAAMATDLGDYAVVEYAAVSCGTLGEALEATARYIDLINDAVKYSLEYRGHWAVLKISSRLPFSRAALDFQLGTLYRVGLNWIDADLPPERQVWFGYAPPGDRSTYATVFRGAHVRFNTACTGLAWPAAALKAPLRTADPKLNAVLRRHAERLMADLNRHETFHDRVRGMIIDGLADGTGTADAIAARLHMSRRTLLRKLEREGTTFKELADNTRRQFAMRYLEAGELDASEIATMLGFAQPSAFHRAFRRWTGTTPLAYRRAFVARQGNIRRALQPLAS